MQRMSLLLSAAAAAALLLGACSQTTDPSVGEPADAPAATETPMQQAADLPPGTTIKADDGSKIKKQADGDINRTYAER